MKVFVIGGVVVTKEDPAYPPQLTLLKELMTDIGSGLVRAGHDILVCSPFAGSADRYAVEGSAEALSNVRGPMIEFHAPDLPAVRRELEHLVESLSPERIRAFYQPISSNEHGVTQLTYTWLLAQLAALDRCNLVLALGGKVDGPASLLLPLAENQRRDVLPLAFMGGAASQSFERLRYELLNRLGDDMVFLQDKRSVGEAIALISRLPNRQRSRPQGSAPIRVFVSYPSARPMEADIVEMVLRRKGCEVYRDEENFVAGQSIPGSIREHIHRSNVFVAVWSKEYACSPWCFDELDIAFARSKEGVLAIWILRVDDTRIVPPLARDKLSHHPDPGLTGRNSSQVAPRD